MIEFATGHFLSGAQAFITDDTNIRMSQNFMRRLAERPVNVFFLLRNFFRS
jgi:hypothetical protein